MVEYPIVVYQERKWTVYVHVNKINGKKYVGITSRNPNDRWGKNGNNYGKNNKKTRSKFWNAICKYGWDNFLHIVIDYKFNHEEAKKVEMMLISYFDSKENGYNMTLGGDGSKGCVPSEETRRKIAWTSSRENLSEETRRKLRESHLKENLSEETIEKYREAMRRRVAEGKTYKFTDEQKKQLRKSRINQMRNVICVNTMDVFLGASYASDILHITKTAIKNNCKCKSQHSGVHPETKEQLFWMFLDDYNNLNEIEKENIKKKYYTGATSLYNFKEE